MRVKERQRRSRLAILKILRAGQNRIANKCVFGVFSEERAINFLLVEEFCFGRRLGGYHAARDFDFRVVAEVQLKFPVVVQARSVLKHFFQKRQPRIIFNVRAAGYPFKNS